jgi:hypothetical protein
MQTETVLATSLYLPGNKHTTSLHLMIFIRSSRALFFYQRFTCLFRRDILYQTEAKNKSISAAWHPHYLCTYNHKFTDKFVEII